jgi:hypothetical protein
MYKLIIMLLWSLNLQAGVGGIEGGSVHFQKDSTWVNMVYSKKLCYQDQTFYAPGKKCLKWERDSDDRRCVKSVKTLMVQPEYSTRMRCKKRDDDRCIEWEVVKYHQKRDRVVRFKDEDGHVIKTQAFRVKGCK